jgi:general stress protein 26
MADMDEQSTERIWRTIEKIGVGMLTTYGSDGLRARPMQSIVRRDEHAVWFLTDRRSHKLDEIKDNPDVLVTYSSGGSEDVSINGQIEAVDDRSKIQEFWSPAATTYFPDGPADPSAILLRFMPITAEFWTGTQNPLTFAFKTIQAKLMGERAALGEHGTVEMP